MSWFDRNWYSTRAKSTAPFDRNQKQAINSSFLNGSPGLSRSPFPDKQKQYGYKLGSVPSLRLMRWSKSFGGITKNKFAESSSLQNSPRSILRSSVLDRPCTVKISAPKRTFNTNISVKKSGGLFSDHVLSNSTASLNSPYSMDKVVSSLKDFDTKLSSKRSCSELNDIFETSSGVVKKRRKVESCDAESKLSAKKCPTSSPEKHTNGDSSLPLLSLSKGYQGFWQDAALLASLSTSRKWLTEELKESLPTVGQDCDNVYSLSRCTTPDSAQGSEVSVNSSAAQKSLRGNSLLGGAVGGGDTSRSPSVANYPGSRIPLIAHPHLIPDKMPYGAGVPLYTHKVILREVSTNTDPDWMNSGGESSQALKEKQFAEDLEKDRQTDMERVNRLLGIESPKTQASTTLSTFGLATTPKAVTSSSDATPSTKSAFSTAKVSSDQPAAVISQPSSLSTFSSSIAAKVQKPASDLTSTSASPKNVQFSADVASKALTTAANNSPINSSIFKSFTSSSPQAIVSVAPTFGSMVTAAKSTSDQQTDSKTSTTSTAEVAGNAKSLFGSLASSVVPSSDPKLTFGGKETTSMFGNIQSSPSKSLAAVPSMAAPATTTAASMTPFSFAAPLTSTDSKVPSNFAFGSFAPAGKTDSSANPANSVSVVTTAPVAAVNNTLSSIANSEIKHITPTSSTASVTSSTNSLFQTFACGVVGGGTSGPPVFGFGKVDNNAADTATSTLFGSKPEVPSATSQTNSSVKSSLPSFSFNATPTTSTSTLFGNSAGSSFAFGASTNSQSQQAVKPASQLGSSEKPTASTGPVLGAGSLFGNTSQPAVSTSANTLSGGATSMFKFGGQSSATGSSSNFAFGASSTQNSAVTTTSGFTFGAAPASQTAATTSSFAFGSSLGAPNTVSTTSSGFTFGAAVNQNTAVTTASSSTFAFGAPASNQNTTAQPLFGSSLNTFTSSQAAATTLATPFGASTATSSTGVFGSANNATGSSTGTSGIFGSNTGGASGSSEPFGSQNTSLTMFGNSVTSKPLAFGTNSNSAGSLFSTGPQSQTSSTGPSIFGTTNNAPSAQSIFGQASNATAAAAPALPGVASFTFGASTQPMNSTASPAAPLFQFGGGSASTGGMTFGTSSTSGISNPALGAPSPIQNPQDPVAAGAFSIGTTASSDSSLPNRRIRTATRKGSKNVRK